MGLLAIVLWFQSECPREAVESIKAAEAFEHVRILSSDDYEGREAGTAGCEKAAEYLVGQLKKWKLRPAGADGGFTQKFDAGGATRNVLAWIEGSDAALKKEYVAIGAHYDHIGRMASGRKGDLLCNGADDNASGTAVVLEVAEAWAALKTPPARSVVFMWWSAEEKDLAGSSHFIRNPTIDLKQVVAYLNLDMVGRNAPDRIDIEGTGCSPDLRAVFEKVNGAKIFARVDYSVAEVKPDTDHYPFYAAGIPAVEFFSGYHADYHKPSDEAERIERPKLERTGRFVALAAWQLAQAERRPGFQKAKR